MDQCHHPLVRPEADYLAHGRLLETGGRPPVRSEPAGSSSEQHGIHRCSSRMQVLVVGVRVDATTEVVDVNFAGSVGVKKLDTAFAPLSRA